MRIALVIPRYGINSIGGAETLAKGFAETAAIRGWEVEIWTTCIRSYRQWDNVYQPGLYRENGIRIRRFPIQWSNRRKWIGLEIKLAYQGFLPPEEAYQWLDDGPHSPSLYAHICRYATDFDVIVALPYMMPLVHYAAWTAPNRVVLWPCLHDEPYAYLEPVSLLLESVFGVIFNSPEESHLALHRLQSRPQRQAVLGAGVCLSTSHLALSSRKYGFPYLLYVGRLEEGKNLGLLYDFAKQYYTERRTFRLVVVGEGPLRPPPEPPFVYKGVISDKEKALLYHNAVALCQPSLRESFSLSIMESWLAGRPVLVHEKCPVTKGHVQRSKGGLWFRSYEEFAEALDWLLEHPELAARMGENGKQYVLANYTWEAILNRFETLIHQWKNE